MESEAGKRLFGRLRELRLQRDLTQEKFAEQAGLKYKHYQAVEAGRKPDLRLSTIEKLAKALGLEIWELFLPPASYVAKARAKLPRPRRRPAKK